jgi:hypothetical protein
MLAKARRNKLFSRHRAGGGALTSGGSGSAGMKYFRPDLPSHQYLDMNLFPSQSALNDAYRSLVRFMNWTDLAIIYEDDLGTFHSAVT